MKAELVPIDSLTFDPSNVRKHGEQNLATIKASLNRSASRNQSWWMRTALSAPETAL
jgi:hypothetical protein